MSVMSLLSKGCEANSSSPFWWEAQPWDIFRHVEYATNTLRVSVSSSLTVSTTVAPTLRIIAYVIISLFVCCKLVPLITYPWKIPGHPTISRGAISSQPQGALKLTKWHVLTYRKCGRQSSSVYFTATFKGLGATLYLQGSAASTADARSHFFGGACGEYAPTFSLMILRANACKVFLGKVMWWCVFERMIRREFQSHVTWDA